MKLCIVSQNNLEFDKIVAARQGPILGALGAIVGSVLSGVLTGISGGAAVSLPGPLGIANWTAAIDVAKEELCPDSETKLSGGSWTATPCKLITALSDLLEEPEAALEKFPRYEMYVLQHCIDK